MRGHCAANASGDTAVRTATPGRARARHRPARRPAPGSSPAAHHVNGAGPCSNATPPGESRSASKGDTGTAWSAPSPLRQNQLDIIWYIWPGVVRRRHRHRGSGGRSEAGAPGEGRSARGSAGRARCRWKSGAWNCWVPAPAPARRCPWLTSPGAGLRPLPRMARATVMVPGLQRPPDGAAFSSKVFDRRILVEVQAAIPAARLLVFDVRQGWEPLCAFLGTPSPGQAPSPRPTNAEVHSGASGRAGSCA